MPRVFGKVQDYKSLSRAARQRLKWMDYYYSHGKNASLTIRHFGISPRTFYKWLKRYNPKDLKRLEDRSRKPKKVRRRTTPKEVEEKIIALRKVHIAWGKAKLKVLLQRKSYRALDQISRVINEKSSFLARRMFKNGYLPILPPHFCTPFLLRGQRSFKKRRFNRKPASHEQLKAFAVFSFISFP